MPPVTATLRSSDEITGQLEAHLRKEQERIRAEIHNYPPPIPACDAQFNYLLEQRARIAQELRAAQNLAEAATDSVISPAALRQAIADSEILQAAVKKRLLRELA